MERHGPLENQVDPFRVDPLIDQSHHGIEFPVATFRGGLPQHVATESGFPRTQFRACEFPLQQGAAGAYPDLLIRGFDQVFKLVVFVEVVKSQPQVTGNRVGGQ